MPEEKNNSTTFLIIILVVVILITLSLFALYLYNSPKTASSLPAFLGNVTQKNNPSTNTNKVAEVPSGTGTDLTPGPLVPVNTSIFEGYLQELSQKPRTIDGILYTYVIGLLDKNGNSLPVWITQKEYENMKVYDTRNGSRTATNLNAVRGGQLVRVTRTTPQDGTPEQSSIMMEILPL